MKRKEFERMLREDGFLLIRSRGKHSVYMREQDEIFPVPRGNNIINKGIIWNYKRRFKTEKLMRRENMELCSYCGERLGDWDELIDDYICQVCSESQYSSW